MKLKGILAIAAVAAVGFGASQAHAAGKMVSEPGLTPYTIVDGGIPKSLTGQAGDAANGRKVVIHRKKGNCLACHQMPIPEEQFHGETGPDLAGVGDRLTEAELRLRLVNPKTVNEDTMMPSFYRTAGYTQINKNFADKSILTAQEVEDVIAYLKTLK